ncbi:MAG TPA: response regulator [Candidatus Paceibacterota bacterium]
MTEVSIKQKTILLVDDDAFLLSMYASKFVANGFVVEKMGSGDDALTKLRDGFVPDMIIFDMVMPNIDGYDLLEALNREQLAPSAVRIALTNETAPEQEARARTLGVDGYIAKASNIPSEVVAEVLRVAESARK